MQYMMTSQQQEYLLYATLKMPIRLLKFYIKNWLKRNQTQTKKIKQKISKKQISKRRIFARYFAILEWLLPQYF